MGGVLAHFPAQVVEYDLRHKRAKVTITLCGEQRELQLSVVREDDEDTGQEPIQYNRNKWIVHEPGRQRQLPPPQP